MLEEKTVWAIEDSSSMRMLMAIIFSQRGYAVQTFGNARDAHTALENGARPDAVVCDLHFDDGDMDGAEFYMASEAYLEKAAKFMVTADRTINKSQYTSFGVKVITKPFNNTEIIDIVEKGMEEIANKR